MSYNETILNASNNIGIIWGNVSTILENDEKYFNQLVNICYDKLIINEFRSIEAKSVISKYLKYINNRIPTLN